MKLLPLTTAAAACFMMAACAHSSYQTGVPAHQATQAFAHIGKQAGTEGHQVYTHPDRLHVRYDQNTEIQFAVQGPTLMMGVIVDDGGMTPDAVQGLMKKASDKGFEWIEMAKKAMAGSPAPAPAPVAAPAPAPAPAAVPDATASCQKLFACYAQLATDFCQAGGAECQFKIEMSGTDDEACKEVLVNVSAMVQPLMMMKPGYTIPAVCQ